MKVINWVNMYNDDDKYKDLTEEEFKEAWRVVVEDVRDHNYHFNGGYHQYGEHGMPIMDNDKKFCVSQRMWGQLMVEAYPEEFEDPNDESNYVRWYIGIDEKDKCKFPREEEE